MNYKILKLKDNKEIKEQFSETENFKLFQDINYNTLNKEIYYFISKESNYITITNKNKNYTIHYNINNEELFSLCKDLIITNENVYNINESIIFYNELLETEIIFSINEIIKKLNIEEIIYIFNEFNNNNYYEENIYNYNINDLKEIFSNNKLLEIFYTISKTNNIKPLHYIYFNENNYFIISKEKIINEFISLLLDNKENDSLKALIYDHIF